MTLNVYSTSLTKSVNSLFLLLIICSIGVRAQIPDISPRTALLQDISLRSDQQEATEVFPEPKKVLLRSVMVPGWGQITNKQAWKVPIVYGLLGGLTYYSIDMHKKYHDYRAAYYNSVNGAESDLRFGSTPSYISPTASASSLRNNRNFFRNRRDFVYVSIALAYVLNIVDAYVFAHMRSFDVSDNLSMRTESLPSDGWMASSNLIPAFTLTIDLN